jgi:predicted nucleotidyltransferase
MNFPKVLQTLQSEFANKKIDFALIGGLAIHALGISRTTRDVDCLALLSDAADIERIMQRLGYETLQRTNDVANYVSKDWEMGRVDVLFAHRKYALAMMQRAKSIPLFGDPIKVLMPEDIIGLKVQSIANDAERRYKDMADIEMLMKTHGKNLKWELVKEYFDVFGRGQEFDELARRFGNAK